MDLTELRRLFNEAAERVRAAVDAVERADQNADAAWLQTELDEAIADAERAQARVRQAEERQRALERFQPLAVEPARTPEVRVGAEEPVYRPDGGRSFFRDLFFRGQDGDAAEAIGRHSEMMRAVTTGDPGAGGVVPPVYLTELFVDVVREGRPVADVLDAGLPLPDTGMTIELPRIAQGVAVSAQAVQNTQIANQDADTDRVSFAVRTIAGMQDVSIQSVERTDPAFDQWVMRDLVAAYDEEVDRELLVGLSANAEHVGIDNQAGITLITYTSAAPNPVELRRKGYQALSQLTTDIRRPASHWLMHPRRAAWLAAATSAESPVFPQLGAIAGQTGAQRGGSLREFLGLPVIEDTQIPVALGAGGNEDAIYLVRAPEIPFMEGALRTGTHTSPGAHTLTVRFVAFAYSAFAGVRRPQAILKVGGTGLVAPVF